MDLVPYHDELGEMLLVLHEQGICCKVPWQL